MSNLPPNPYNNTAGGPQKSANAGPPMFNHSQQFGQVPASQLPPGYTPGLKQDANSNSPVHAGTPVPQNNALQNINNYNQSGNSSPAFNQPGMLPPMPTSLQSSPIRPATSLPSNKNPLPPSVSQSSGSPKTVLSSNPSPTPYPLNIQPQRQINEIAPPLVPSSQFSQPLVNGPPISSPPGHAMPLSQFPTTSSGFSAPPIVNKPTVSVSSYNAPPMTQAFGPPPVSKLSGPNPIESQPNMPLPPVNGPMSGQMGSQPLGPPSLGMNGPSMVGPPVSGSQLVPSNVSGPGLPPLNGPQSNQSKPPGPPGIQNIGPPGIPRSGPVGLRFGGPEHPQNTSFGPQASGPLPPGPSKLAPQMGSSLPPQSGSLVSGTLPPRSRLLGPQMGAHLPPQSVPLGPHKSVPLPPQAGPYRPQMGVHLPPQTGPLGPQMPPQPSHMKGPSQQFPNPPQNGPSFPPMSTPGPSIGPPSGPQSQPAQFPPTQPPMGHQMGPPSGPSNPAMKSNMQSRYPQMPPSNFNNQPPVQPGMPPQYPQQQMPQQQYNTQAMTQQMGQLSVTRQGFDQLWGHQMVDLLQCRHILPEYPEDPPEIKLAGQFAEAANCSPEIFRCTINKIPETNSLLQKSRLPLGILIHPFKDLNHLPVIQCNTIVRCRACRTYINPFVYFVDAKRWKCNLCYRVNDLPEEFQYDPVSKSYGDPSRRPEIKSATIEFIAPGEYMLRPPQPAVYLFLMDVSQIARDSGYLQVVCDTLKASLDQLPGDARTQVGFVCFDSHVHYYNMSDGLTRPKEMTVLDIDDVFLPSPESLLVNLAERRELIRELLTVLPGRHCGPGVPGSALGAALQAAYKLMAPTGGRITVFQTCLPNTGPGALQAREDPNARSSKEVAHLNPATDFYKRLALDCSGAQVAVDLFLLNSQYSDLATLSGMSKFSGGTVYHIPLFKASRAWQAEQLSRMFGRYLTRKIGFEAVMRVRCTRGLSIHTFHGNFFVRSTDLLSLPNVSPDAGFGMQLTIDESLSDLQHACFQAALLYTSSKGERRIRVHTMALPIASTLPDVLHAADQQCIIGLLSKMAVDRAMSASMSEAREAVMNVAVDALSAHRLAQNLPAGAAAAHLHAPLSLRLLPLYLLALLKRRAFRTGMSTRLDDRVADMCALKSAPLSLLLRAVYPHLYPIHALRDHLIRSEDDEELVPDPPRLHLSAERINSTGAYLLDDGESMIIYVGHNVSPAFLSETFGVAAFTQLPDEARSLPRLENEGSALLHALIERFNDDRPYASDILVLRDNSPSKQQFTERLIDDRVESAFSYYEFLQHVKSQVK